jgi:hypothetical protein
MIAGAPRPIMAAAPGVGALRIEVVLQELGRAKFLWKIGACQSTLPGAGRTNHDQSRYFRG